MILSKWYAVLGCLLVLSCATPEAETQNESGQPIPLKYAKGFSVEQHGDCYRVLLHKAWKSSTQPIEYWLCPAGVESNEAIPENHMTYPLKKVLGLSTTQVAFLVALDQREALTGLSGVPYLNDSIIYSNVLEGKVSDLGDEFRLNYELMVDLDPDAVWAYGIDNDAEARINRMKELGLNPILSAEYLEETPLGKAEWIKFFALFFDQLDVATAIFDQIETEYLAIKKEAESAAEHPTVFVGLPWKGEWYQAGGKSFQACLFRDAGAQYLWRDNEEISGIVVDREVVFEVALEADYWLNVGTAFTREEIVGQDPRYAHFQAFAEQQVYNNNNRMNDRGGNDYWESGIMAPHLVLRDLVKIFHPELFPDQPLIYYRRLP